jgi:hypothetical protein
MSSVFLTLPLQERKRLVKALTILVKRWKDSDDGVPSFAYYGDLASLKTEVDKIKKHIEFKQIQQRHVVAEVLESLCDPILFEDLGLDQVSEIRIKYDTKSLLSIINTNLTCAYKYKSVLDLRDLFEASPIIKNNLAAEAAEAAAGMSRVQYICIGAILGFGVALFLHCSPSRSASCREDTVTLLKSLSL